MECSDDGMDCNQILDDVYEYLHNELDEQRRSLVRGHLDSCGHCLQQYGIEEEVQHLLERSCGCSQAPQELRDRIVERITTIRVSGQSAAGSFTAQASLRVTRRELN